MIKWLRTSGGITATNLKGKRERERERTSIENFVAKENIKKSTQTPQESIFFVDPIRRSHPTRCDVINTPGERKAEEKEEDDDDREAHRWREEKE